MTLESKCFSVKSRINKIDLKIRKCNEYKNTLERKKLQKNLDITHRHEIKNIQNKQQKLYDIEVNN